MRKISALVVTLLLCLSASVAAAADTVKGMVKKVDDKAATITFAREGGDKEEVLAVDKGLDLKKVKAGAKAEVKLDGGVVKEIKQERPKAAGY